MRLIDVDAFKNDYRMADECKDCQTHINACEHDRVYTKMDFCEWLDSAPTIQLTILNTQSERKKGKWILVKSSNGKDYHKCSECLHTQNITGVKNYCPVCGADMEGEKDDTD